MSEKILDLLNDIYDSEQARATYERLIHMMEESKNRMGAQDERPLFSERDTVLITYGDSLKRPGEAPLKTLHDFASKQMTDLIAAIHILPFFPYSSDDGFSVLDFYAVNPDLGTWEDVERLGRDFELMFDAVFNHMSAQSEWFKQFLAGDPEFSGMFRVEDPNTDLSSVTRPRSSPLLTEFQKTKGETVHVWTTFSADQVDLDFSTPETLLHMMKVLLFYMEHGARLIRLDAIAYLWKVVGTTSIHLKETHRVIELMRAVMDFVAPGSIIITETNVPHAENVSYFGNGYNEAQMVYNFTLPPLLFHTLLSGNADKLRAWVDTLETPSEQTTFFNFTASHDGIGVRPVEDILNAQELQALIAHAESSGGRVSYKRNSDGSESPYELNVTYVNALTDPNESEAMQVRRFLVSQAIAMSLAGVPAVYIHSLLGSRNDLEGVQRTGHNRTINRAKLDADSITAALNDPASFRAQIFTQYANLLKTRRAERAFHPNGAQTTFDTGNLAVFGLLRSYQGERIVAVFNVTGQHQKADLSPVLSGSGTDILTGQRVESSLDLDPYQVCWIK